MKVEDKKVVSIHFTLKNKLGDILETSQGEPPLDFIQGCGNIIPGLEKALRDKQAGDQLNVIIAPEDAYGMRDESLLQTVPLSDFSGQDNLEEGAEIDVETTQGICTAMIAKVNTDNVILDLNHPLASETLHFDVEITNIREAKKDELEHGHVHDPECRGH